MCFIISDTAEANSLPQSAITVSVKGIPTRAKTMQKALPPVVIGTISPYPANKRSNIFLL